ncbi:MAG: CRISPR-associated endonuclease Cas1 [Gammaproteobacteria bacterium]|nr:MAG: CRISPR-associated endonuclease Cas1 [Gammaproteobacteria bacterium]
MATLYVDHRDSELRAEGRAIALYRGEERIRTVPVALLDRVVIVGTARFDSTVLGVLAAGNVVLAVCSARDPRRWGIFTGPMHGDARIRIAQARVFLDRRLRLEVARTILHGKLVRYRRFLRQALRQRADARYRIQPALDTLQGALEQLPGITSLERLRGLEGSTAHACFSAYAALVPSELGFRQRMRRPPPDPVNALLSLTYTLLHARAHAILHGAGIDPAVGMLHDPSHGRASAAADLVELWRAHADAWVWRLLAKREIRREHFRDDGFSCLLAKPGRRKFYVLFENWARHVDRAMRRQVRHAVRFLRGVYHGG